MADMYINGPVRISGAINDVEFSAEGEAGGNPSTGEYTVKLAYTNIPKGWHPLMYTDVKVSLLFLREVGKGKNFLSLTGGIYRSAGTIDLGNGNLLRNHTVIRMIDESRLEAVYVMSGTAQTGELVDMEYFEETMLPMGPGAIAALAIARWKTSSGEPLDAIFSTKYTFDPKHRLDRAQFRRLEAHPTFDGQVFSSTYVGFVQDLPRPELEDKGPYIGHLIA